MSDYLNDTIIRYNIEMRADKHSNSDGDYWIIFENVDCSMEVCISDYYKLSKGSSVYIAVDTEQKIPFAFSYTYDGDKLKE